jgi:NADPH:quinone reductase-like Zn-dependent oxidoreductase
MVAVYRSTVINAPIDDVWQLLRDFNAHYRWHPAVAESNIENGQYPDQIGCVRRFKLQEDSGTELREQLLSLSDFHHRFVYCILQAPLPLYGYLATLSLKPVTDGDHTFWEWFSSFTTPVGQEEQLIRLVGEQIYQAGFDAVKQYFGQNVVTRPPPRQTLRTIPAAAAAVVSAAGSIDCQAIVVAQFGGPEQLRWQPVTVPPPGAGEIRIRHTAIGLNYIDIYCRTGYFPLLQPPAVPGMEGAGVVTDVGTGVYGIMPGDRVAYACPPVGAYSEYRTLSAELIVVLPPEIDDETAAAGLLKGMTAEFLLHRVHVVKEGDVVLVHAAAGGVGLLLCQWARHLGATVIGTVGSAVKARLARDHGCSYPIIYTQQDFVAQVMAITGGHGADVVYDAVGRDTFMQSFAALAIRGHLVSYGQASGDIGAVDIAGFAAKSASVSRPNFAQYTATGEAVRAISDRLFSAIANGVVRVQARQRYALRDAAAAQQALESRATTGSVILLP